MNTFFESVFKQATEQFLEATTQAFEVQNELFSKIERKHNFYRMPYFQGRRYITVAYGEPYLMTGLTSITKKIQNIRDEDKFLHEWRLNMVESGKDPEEFAYIASEFGTLVHIVAANLFSARAKNETFHTRGMDKELLQYMQRIGISTYHFKDWYKNLAGAIRSLNQFYTKTDMEVLAIEHCVADFENNICTPLDIICNITTTESIDVPLKTKEGTKRVKQDVRNLWALNIKARNNPDRRSNDKYQLCAEHYIANKYLDLNIEKTGALSPSWNWKVKENADCKLHEFTGAFSEKDWDAYINFLKNEPGRPNYDLFTPDLTQRVGDANIFTVTESGDVVNFPEISISEYINNKFKLL